MSVRQLIVPMVASVSMLLVPGTASGDKTPAPPPTATQTAPAPSTGSIPIGGVTTIQYGPDTAAVAGQLPGASGGSGPSYGEEAVITSEPGSDDVSLCQTNQWGDGWVTFCRKPLIRSGPIDVVSTAEAASSAVARLSVPSPQINISPQPSDNKWNVLAVGLPLWVWATDQAPVTTSVSEQGIDISMTATRGTVRFDWGDGTSSTCELMRPRPQGMDPLTPSPDCGHTYLKKGDYVVTATAAWAVNWQALGQSGTLPLTSTNTMSIPIREFSSVVVG